jgi:uncharacterized membrane protein HdeD (DUF308 family)
MLTMLAAQNWGLFIVRGVLAIILGVLALVVPGPTLAALILVFAWYALFDGVMAIGAGFGAPGGPRWGIVLGGILAIGIGAYTLFNPGVTAIALVLLIGAWSIVRGVAEIVTVVQLRKMIEGEWLYILSGVVSVLFGAFVVVSPGTGALAVLWLIGYYALFAGVMYLLAGWRLRGVNKAVSGGAGGAMSN